MRNKILKGLSWSIYDKVINQLVTLTVMIYLTRELTPHDFGIIGMLTIILVISQNLIDSGFSQALIYKSKSTTSNDFTTVFYITLIVSLLVYFCIYILSPGISYFYDEPKLESVSVVLALTIVFNSLSIVPISKFTIDLDFKTPALINSISIFISVLFTISAVYYFNNYWAIVTLSLSRAISKSLLFLYFCRWRPSGFICLNSYKSLFAFGKNLLLSGLMTSIVQNINSVVIGKNYSTKELGYYQQGINYSSLFSSSLSLIINGVCYPSMSSIKDERQKICSYYEKTITGMFFIVCPMFIFPAFFAESIFTLVFGEQWVGFYEVFSILLISRMITPLSSLNLDMLKVLNMTNTILKLDFIKLPLSVITLIIFIPYGVKAICISQVFLNISFFLVNAYYPYKELNLSWIKMLKELLITLCITTVVVISYKYADFIIFDNKAISEFIVMLLCFFTYIGISLMLKVNSLHYILDSYNKKS